MDNVCLFTLSDEVRAVWEITHRCNLNCKHCCSDSSDLKNDELTTKQIKKGLDNLVNGGMKSIYFSGGEPLIREDIFEILEYTANLIVSDNSPPS